MAHAIDSSHADAGTGCRATRSLLCLVLLAAAAAGAGCSAKLTDTESLSLRLMPVGDEAISAVAIAEYVEVHTTVDSGIRDSSKLLAAEIVEPDDSRFRWTTRPLVKSVLPIWFLSVFMKESRITLYSPGRVVTTVYPSKRVETIGTEPIAAIALKTGDYDDTMQQNRHTSMGSYPGLDGSYPYRNLIARSGQDLAVHLRTLDPPIKTARLAITEYLPADPDNLITDKDVYTFRVQLLNTRRAIKRIGPKNIPPEARRLIRDAVRAEFDAIVAADMGAYFFSHPADQYSPPAPVPEETTRLVEEIERLLAD